MRSIEDATERLRNKTSYPLAEPPAADAANKDRQEPVDMDPVARDRKALLRAYQIECVRAGRRKPSQTDIGKACGWSDRTTIAWWLSNNPRCTKAHDSKIRDILKKKPHLHE